MGKYRISGLKWTQVVSRVVKVAESDQSHFLGKTGQRKAGSGDINFVAICALPVTIYDFFVEISIFSVLITALPLIICALPMASGALLIAICAQLLLICALHWQLVIYDLLNSCWLLNARQSSWMYHRVYWHILS